MKRVGCFLILNLMLTGCQITRVEGEYRDVEVKYRHGKEAGHDGDFCPPGQAKKGRC
ncbi:MAG: hypothetical protein AAGJ78_00410 [Pseudomonadota bacterium]